MLGGLAVLQHPGEVRLFLDDVLDGNRHVFPQGKGQLTRFNDFDVVRQVHPANGHRALINHGAAAVGEDGGHDFAACAAEFAARHAVVIGHVPRGIAALCRAVRCLLRFAVQLLGVRLIRGCGGSDFLGHLGRLAGHQVINGLTGRTHPRTGLLRVLECLSSVLDAPTRSLGSLFRFRAREGPFRLLKGSRCPGVFLLRGLDEFAKLAERFEGRRAVALDGILRRLLDWNFLDRGLNRLFCDRRNRGGNTVIRIERGLTRVGRTNLMTVPTGEQTVPDQLFYRVLSGRAALLALYPGKEVVHLPGVRADDVHAPRFVLDVQEPQRGALHELGLCLTEGIGVPWRCGHLRETPNRLVSRVGAPGVESSAIPLPPDYRRKSGRIAGARGNE
ncbi:hypothetical protein [Streptomyces sp. NPDC059411]|uniref:hypothetical protein n=1 Tax=Streptomyces sp. NPDC059411 TaxID=3346825 RepID=UPI00368CF129